MEIIKVGIVGAGTMGAGIAQRCAMHGYMVVLVDTNPETLDAAEAHIQKSLDRFIEKGTLSPEGRLDALAKIHRSTELKQISDCDLVIEAVPEKLEVKREIFSELDWMCPPETILASNTSSFSITRLALSTRHPERVLGLHFMNPAPLIDFVELVRGKETSEEVAEKGKQFARSLACEVIESKDAPGFIINRVLMPMVNEAIYALEAGVASVEDIDRAMVQGTHQPVGPLALADRIGLDVVLSILNTLHQELADERFRPCALLAEYVHQGRLGRKSGKGFYDYEKISPTKV
ncbi:MAG: 3-hydroxyacyl-CoA dehydrogenase NAD-binding domain-containing protein [Nitrospinota bacterium]|nr:3-hydroxyacyl-CoA dehydrogenase NAD-binding domain-containing protein [Nitrospinota bacterium]